MLQEGLFEITLQTGPPTTIPRPAAYCPRPPSQPTLSLDSLSHTLRAPPTVSTIPSPRHHLSSAWSTRPQTTTRTAIPRITRTQSPPRGRMCGVVPLALCARDTSCTCPPSLPLLKTHAACTSLTRCRVVFDPAARAWSLLLNSFAHHRFGDVGILGSSLRFSSLGVGRRGHLDALLLLLRRLDLLEQPVLWRREDLADE